jgi:hypothetical protein
MRTCFLLDCPLSIKNPVTISNDLSCHIPDYCTAADICVYIPLINRNIHAYLRLHSCDALLEVGIEQFTFSVGLFDYEFGKYDFLFSVLTTLACLFVCFRHFFAFEYHLLTILLYKKDTYFNSFKEYICKSILQT